MCVLGTALSAPQVYFRQYFGGKESVIQQVPGKSPFDIPSESPQASQGNIQVFQAVPEGGSSTKDETPTLHQPEEGLGQTVSDSDFSKGEETQKAPEEVTQLSEENLEPTVQPLGLDFQQPRTVLEPQIEAEQPSATIQPESLDFQSPGKVHQPQTYAELPPSLPVCSPERVAQPDGPNCYQTEVLQTLLSLPLVQIQRVFCRNAKLLMKKLAPLSMIQSATPSMRKNVIPLKGKFVKQPMRKNVIYYATIFFQSVLINFKIYN